MTSGELPLEPKNRFFVPGKLSESTIGKTKLRNPAIAGFFCALLWAQNPSNQSSHSLGCDR